MVPSDKSQPPTKPARRRAPDTGIPHPSWREAITGTGPGTGHIASAGDFWARLGI